MRTGWAGWGPRLRFVVAGVVAAVMVPVIGVVASARPLGADRGAQAASHATRPANPAVKQEPVDQGAARILLLVNATRAAAGRSILTWDPHLATIAEGWSATMAATGSLHHSNLDATIREPQNAGYAFLGENILVGPGTLTSDAMHRAWMASPRHAENVLDPDFNTVGTAVVRDANGRVWATEAFGSRT